MLEKSPLDGQLNAYLATIEEKGLYRRRKLVDQNAINFSCNDYLSLRYEPKIQKAFQEGFLHLPAGSGASMVVSGYHPIHQRLERSFAEALGVDDCLLFSSGFAANLGIAALLKQLNALILIDKAVHASIYDGLGSAFVEYRRYQHTDLLDLQKKLGLESSLEENHKSRLVLTESIFSMSGQKSDLASISKMLRPGIDALIVDEAHSFGLYGPQGLGSVLEHGLTQEQVPLRCIPFGKSLAGSGAIVAGSKIWIEALQQSSRPHIYSTALSPAYCHGLLESFDFIRAADNRRRNLKEKIQYFRQATMDSIAKWADSETPIQQLRLGCPLRAQACSLYLKSKGIICLPMRQPTVSKQDTGLRIVLNFEHEITDINALLIGIQDFLALELKQGFKYVEATEY